MRAKVDVPAVGRADGLAARRLLAIPGDGLRGQAVGGTPAGNSRNVARRSHGIVQRPPRGRADYDSPATRVTWVDVPERARTSHLRLRRRRTRNQRTSPALGSGRARCLHRCSEHKSTCRNSLFPTGRAPVLDSERSRVSRRVSLEAVAWLRLNRAIDRGTLGGSPANPGPFRERRGFTQLGRSRSCLGGARDLDTRTSC